MATRVTPIRIPELDQFILSNVESTGVEIGRGAYGSVEEVKIPGATCAAKRLHEELLRMGSERQVREWTSAFVRECTLMSQLRHPHIVQFLGIFFQPGSRLPLLVMERLITNLDTVLETTPEIPLDIKRSMLLDVARGLTFLHSHAPPIVHRDLTARNVLLNSAMVAKIADLGVARIVNIGPSQLAATMTRAPGNIVYMPPEAVEQQSRYSTAIDVFSYGNLALFTLTQDFPELKSATYVDPRSRRVVGRTEIERRMDYFEKLYRDFGEQHPIVRLVDQCLQNIPEDRPSISCVVEQLLLVNADHNWDMTKLELVRDIMEKEKVKQGLELEIDRQKEATKVYREQLSQKDDLNQRLLRSLRTRQGSQKRIKLTGVPTAISINWSKCKSLHCFVAAAHSPVVHDGNVYAFNIGGDVIVYNCRLDEWTELSPSPDELQYFTFAVVNDQLMLVGGKSSRGVSDRITVWDSRSQKWHYPYPAMSTACRFAAAIGYQHYLIVVSGKSRSGAYLSSVEILDTTISQWFVAKSLPPIEHSIPRAILVDNILYLVESNKAVFKASVPALIAQATSGTYATAVWERLPDTPLYRSRPTTINNHLVVVGGRTDDGDESTNIHLYNPLTKKWTKVSELPVEPPEYGFECTSLPSGELMIAVDWTVYIGAVTIHHTMS